MKKIIIGLMVLILTLFLVGCTEEEFRGKYEKEIKQEIKEVVKEAVKEALFVDEEIKIEPKNEIKLKENETIDEVASSCSFDNLICQDFLITPDSILLELKDNQNRKIEVKDFDKCSQVTEKSIGDKKILVFKGCSNGEIGQIKEVKLNLIVLLDDEELQVAGKIKDKISESSIELTDNPDYDYCAMSPGFACLDFVIHQDTIILQLGNNKNSNLIVLDFLVGDCTEATSNNKIENYQMFEFKGCNNGEVGSIFNQDIKLILKEGEIEKEIEGHIKSRIN